MIFESQHSIDEALFAIRYMMNITFPFGDLPTPTAEEIENLKNSVKFNFLLH